MTIEWFEKKNKNSAVTIYNNNITVRRNVAKFFENAEGIAVGVDKDEKYLVLKKVYKDTDITNSHKDLFKMDINPSYGRINSKNIINSLTNYCNLDFDKQKAYKYQATWDDKEEMLIINLKEEYNDK